MDIHKEIEHARSEGTAAALCIVVQTKGSTPRKAGARMLVYADGRLSGTIGGGNLEKAVVAHAFEQLQAGTPKLFRHELLQEHNMCCGGTVDIYIEPLPRMNTLYLFGAGHVGKALARLASELDFVLHVIDDRREELDRITTPGVRKVHGQFREVLPALAFSTNAYIVVMTYDHVTDREILAHCIQRPHAYIGMIGSERKARITKRMFSKDGVATVEQLDRVHMPIGKSIAAETPEEIAISILAELIEVKNNACVNK
ncbi:MAG: xanthine dehydrogenase accessory protein XdhC [Flavobacteriales bacterium]|nr:xanthine dehydrogenase accessory protein XdhC [Flavobacteriales bacterium]